MEDPQCSATLGNVVVRLADQIGMTPAGLKENGWKIATDQVGAKRQTKAAAAGPSARDRLKLVRNGEAG